VLPEPTQTGPKKKKKKKKNRNEYQVYFLGVKADGA
jgi:hypothetical protein